MRLAVFVEFFPPNLGSDRRIFEIMTRSARKNEIHFIVLPPFRALSGKIATPQDRLHFQHKEVVITRNGIVAHYLPVSPMLLGLWKKSYSIGYVLTLLTLFFKAFKCARRIGPAKAILNYPSVYTGILGFVIGKRLLRIPVLLDFSDLIAEYTLHLLDLKSDSLAARFLLFAQSFVVKNSDLIIAPTDYIKRYSSRLGVADEKIRVISNGVDTKLFNPRKYSQEQAKSRLGLEDRKTCMYCGRLDGWAGANIILQLSNTLASRRSSTYFVIVGSGDMQDHVSAENVKAVGGIPYGRVPEMLASADVILVPFPDTEVSRAASPLKLFEAMAMSKAIVASDVDGIKEVISNRENGILIGSNDIAGWANAIEELLSNSLMARRIGENARKATNEKYDWEILARKYEKILAE